MTGARYFNFREGDRSEYLAQYLLSGIGLATPVPRQEDVGVDFHCSIADQESGLLTFGFPFSIQIKSRSSPNVDLGGTKDNAWLDRELRWYLKQSTPLFIGVVDKSALTLAIYDTSPARLAFVKTFPAKLTLAPRTNGDSTTHTGWPRATIDPACAGHGDGQHHTVDLGPPITTLSPEILSDSKLMLEAKNRVRLCVSIEQANIVYAALGTPYFNWLLCCPPGAPPNHAWMHRSTSDPSALKHLLSGLAPPLLSLALSLSQSGRHQEAQQLTGALKMLDPSAIPAELRQHLGALLP